MHHTSRMHDAFTYVIWIVCAIGVVVALVALASSGKVWDEIGKRGLVSDRDRSIGAETESGRVAGADDAAAGAERDAEIRQMLQARNERRARRGEAPVDVEAELRRLTAPATQAPAMQIDAGLREEIRQLVEARNHRRVRRGEEPLDIETEVERQIAKLTSGA